MGRGFLTTRTAIISDAEMIICRMVYELDDIKAQSDCHGLWTRFPCLVQNAAAATNNRMPRLRRNRQAN